VAGPSRTVPFPEPRYRVLSQSRRSRSIQVDQLAYSSVILKPTQVQLLAQDGGALPRRSADKGWRGRRSRALCDNNATRPAGRTVSDSRLADNDVAQHSGELFDSYTKLLDFFLRVTIGLWLD
jgi:hypothetical protein